MIGSTCIQFHRYSYIVFASIICHLMNILAKVVLVVNSLLLLFVFFALIENGIFRQSDTICGSSSSTSNSPTSLPILSPPLYSPKLELQASHDHSYGSRYGNGHVSMSGLAEEQRTNSGLMDESIPFMNGHRSSSCFGQDFPHPYATVDYPYIAGAGVCCYASFWDFIRQFIPCNGIFARLFSFFLNVMYEITLHDIIFFYVFLGVIYCIYYFYLFIRSAQIGCVTSLPNDLQHHCPSDTSSLQNHHQEIQTPHSLDTFDDGNYNGEFPRLDHQKPPMHDDRRNMHPYHHHHQPHNRHPLAHKERKDEFGHEIVDNKPISVN